METNSDKKKVITWLDTAMEARTRKDERGKEETVYIFGKSITQEYKDLLYKKDFKIDDHHYDWLDTAFRDIKDHLKNHDDLKEFNVYECADSAIDVYTSDLTEWLNSRNERIDYLTEAIKERAKDGFQALQMAQGKEINEVFNMAVEIVNTVFEKVKED